MKRQRSKSGSEEDKVRNQRRNNNYSNSNYNNNCESFSSDQMYPPNLTGNNGRPGNSINSAATNNNNYAPQMSDSNRQLLNIQQRSHVMSFSVKIVNHVNKLRVQRGEPVLPASSLKLPPNLDSLTNIDVFPKRKERWNTNEEILSLLLNFGKHEEWQTREIVMRAPSTAMIMYSRKKVRYRRDGYCWRKRKDGKTTREDHMKLKVQGVECIYGCYVHSSVLPTFHRRCYWLLENPDIVIVHYLNVPEEDEEKFKAMMNKAQLGNEEAKRWSRDDLLVQLHPILLYPSDHTEGRTSHHLMVLDAHIDSLTIQIMEKQRQLRDALAVGPSNVPQCECGILDCPGVNICTSLKGTKKTTTTSRKQNKRNSTRKNQQAKSGSTCRNYSRSAGQAAEIFNASGSNYVAQSSSSSNSNTSVSNTGLLITTAEIVDAFSSGPEIFNISGGLNTGIFGSSTVHHQVFGITSLSPASTSSSGIFTTPVLSPDGNSNSSNYIPVGFNNPGLSPGNSNASGLSSGMFSVPCFSPGNSNISDLSSGIFSSPRSSPETYNVSSLSPGNYNAQASSPVGSTGLCLGSFGASTSTSENSNTSVLNSSMFSASSSCSVTSNTSISSSMNVDGMDSGLIDVRLSSSQASDLMCDNNQVAYETLQREQMERNTHSQGSSDVEYYDCPDGNVQLAQYSHFEVQQISSQNGVSAEMDYGCLNQQHHENAEFIRDLTERYLPVNLTPISEIDDLPASDTDLLDIDGYLFGEENAISEVALIMADADSSITVTSTSADAPTTTVNGDIANPDLIGVTYRENTNEFAPGNEQGNAQRTFVHYKIVGEFGSSENAEINLRLISDN